MDLISEFPLNGTLKYCMVCIQEMSPLALASALALGLGSGLSHKMGLNFWEAFTNVLVKQMCSCTQLFGFSESFFSEHFRKFSGLVSTSYNFFLFWGSRMSIPTYLTTVESMQLFDSTFAISFLFVNDPSSVK